MRSGRHARIVAVGLCATALLAVSAAPAPAAIKVGRAVDPTGSNCSAGFNWMQLSVGATSYTVPGTGTITSWTMHGVPPAGQQFTMKVFRKIAEPATYQVVGHAGPQTLTTTGTTGNTFPANIRVQPGDALGFYSPTVSSRCLYPATGAQLFYYGSADLADGASAPFSIQPNFGLNLEASFVPDNGFARTGKIKRNKKKGTATATFELPNPGVLTGAGAGAKVSSAGAVTAKTVTAPGQAKLKIRARGSKLSKLNDKGKVTLKVKVIYTPTGGDARIQQLKVKLRKST